MRTVQAAEAAAELADLDLKDRKWQETLGRRLV